MHSHEHNVGIGLLLSLTYECPRELQLLFSNTIINRTVQNNLCGIDLVGNEQHFDAEVYKPIFDKWRPYGKTLRAHVGEMPGSGPNIKTAIEYLGATRIAHGVQASDDVLKSAADRRIYFDLALHSNLTTGAWDRIETHPLKRMVELGCIATLSTDDPVQFSCTLNDEFELAQKHGLITEVQAKGIMKNAWRAPHHDIT